MSILRIRYANQLAVSEFDLADQVNLMKGEAAILKAILGTTTQLDGFNCTPNSPADLNVIVDAGTIIILEDVLNTALGELPTQIPADTTHQIVKYAYTLDPTTVPVTPPSTPGFSRNDLIQIGFQEADGNSTAIPFFNGFNGQVLNPPVFVTKNTQRIDSIVVQLKAGTPAATGTQVTPSPDTGFVGAWVVTTTTGQTTISSGNITEFTNAPFLTEKLKDKLSQAAADLRYAQLALDNTFTQPQTIPQISASVYLASTQNIPGGNVPTLLNFDTVDRDVFSLWNNTSKEFVATKTGLHAVSVRLFGNYESTALTGSFYVSIEINGTTGYRLNQLLVGNQDLTAFGYVEIELNAGDAVKAFVNNDTSGAVNVGSGLSNNSFQIRYLGTN
jgi:hypothetical protein